LFMVIKKHMNLHEYGTEVAKNESEREWKQKNLIDGKMNLVITKRMLQLI
jgi:hypothetical protein